MRPISKKLDWVGGLIMVPLALVLFVVLRLAAPDFGKVWAALVAAAVSVLLVRTLRVLMARRGGAPQA